MSVATSATVDQLSNLLKLGGGKSRVEGLAARFVAAFDHGGEGGVHLGNTKVTSASHTTYDADYYTREEEKGFFGGHKGDFVWTSGAHDRADAETTVDAGPVFELAAALSGREDGVAKVTDVANALKLYDMHTPQGLPKDGWLYPDEVKSALGDLSPLVSAKASRYDEAYSTYDHYKY